MEQHQADFKAALEQQKQETETKMEALRAELTPTPASAITDGQLTALQARIDGLHQTKLLADEELFTLENLITDWAELQASMEGQVIMQMALYTGNTIGTVHRMVKVSEVSTGDAAFARQLRRKFL